MVELSIGQHPSGNFVSGYGAQINRLNDRIFLGSRFNGEFHYQNVSGLSPLAKALHYWGARDSQLFVESSVGAMSIVGHTQSSDVTTAWPAYPTFKPAGIALSGFAVNDLEGGYCWAGYFDSVRMQGAGFTPAVEICTASFGTTSNITPFNHLTGVSNSVNLWVQAGNGLDLMEEALIPAGLSANNVNHSDAHMVFLTSFTVGSVTTWVKNKAYVVGDLCREPETQIVYRCTVNHTSPSTGIMSTDRAINPTRWKARPAALKGLIFTAGGLAELAPGSNVFSAIEMTERTQISWWRGNDSAAEQSAYIWCDFIPAGTPAVGLTIGQYGMTFSNSHLFLDANKGLYIGGDKVVGSRQPLIPSPNAEVNSLRTAVDSIRVLLVNHGLMSASM